MKLNNYDAIAGSYDTLSRMVFFKAQINAQKAQLACIPAGASILIVGGGTGWILEEITSVHGSGLDITYLEISENMLTLARKRNYGDNKVTFIHQAVEDYSLPQTYDIIQTGFLFDNFSGERAAKVFDILLNHLKPGGYWLYSDFKVEPKGSDWKKAMLQLMYLFFARIAHVEARKLPAMEAMFKASGCDIITRKLHYSGFIESIIFKK